MQGMKPLEAELESSFGAIRSYVIGGVVAIALVGVGYGLFSKHRAEKREVALATLYRVMSEQDAKGGEASAEASQESSLLTAAKSFANEPSAVLLHFEAGLLAEKKKDWAEAKSRYESMLQSFPSQSPYRSLVYLRLANVAEQMGDLAGARAFLVTANEAKTNPQREFVLYALARIDEKQGDLARAREGYSAVTQEFRGSPVAIRALERLAQMPQAPQVPAAEGLVEQKGSAPVKP